MKIRVRVRSQLVVLAEVISADLDDLGRPRDPWTACWPSASSRGPSILGLGLA